MRKMFTRLFGLTLLMYLVSTLNVVQAQCINPVVSLSDVVLVTDPATICDGMDLLYEVQNHPDAEFAFNFDGNFVGGFTSDSTVSVPEGVGFWVQIATLGGTCVSQPLYVPAMASIDPVQIDTSEVEHPLCFGGQGEVTIKFTGDHGPYKYYIMPDSVKQDPALSPILNPTRLNMYRVLSAQIVRGEGSYWVAVQEANDCIDLADVSNWDSTWVNAAPSEIIIDSMAAVDAVCNGGMGEVHVWVQAGTGTPYSTGEYWVTVEDSTKMTTGQMATFMMPAGDYTATVKDSNMCVVVSDTTVTVNEPAEITFDIDIVDVGCADSTDGEIWVHSFMPDTLPNGSPITFEAKIGATGTWTGYTSGDTIKFTGLAPAYYSLFVRNDQGCDSVPYVNPNNTQNTISVQSGDDFDYNVTVDQADCIGGSSTITVSILYGTGPFEYSNDGGTTWVTNPVFTVGAGTYNVVVRQAGACEVPWPAITIDPIFPVVITSIDSVSPTCPGGNDGIIRVNATRVGATLPVFEYSLDSASWKANNVFAVYAGEYQVWVREVGCPASVVSGTIQVDTLDVNKIIVFDSQDVDCYGANNGVITIHKASWASQVGEDRGVMVYYSTDMNDAYVDGKGTKMPLIIPNHHYQATGLAPNTYYIWAVDSMGCVFDTLVDNTPDVLMVEIDEPGKLDVDGEVTGDATCFGDYDGIITITKVAGAPVKYGVANTLAAAINLPDAAYKPWGDGNLSATSTSIQVGKGTYYVIAKDACGMPDITGPWTVGGLDAVTIDPISATGIQCFGDKEGTVTVPMAEGGKGPLAYTLQMSTDGMVWTDVAGYMITEHMPMYTGLAAGWYRVIVDDLGGCDGTVSNAVEVDGPASGVTFTIVSERDITCFGAADGLITIQATGGTGPYEFKIGSTNWRPFPTTGLTNVKQIIATEAGEWPIWVRDAEECVSMPDTAMIDEPDQLVLTIQTLPVTTNCLTPNGQLTVSATGGTGNIVIEIPGVDTTNISGTYIGLSAGTYLVTAIDDNGCEVTEEAMIGNPDSLMAVATVVDSVNCFGDSTGTVNIVVSGGTPPYTVAAPMLGSKVGANVTFTNVFAGTHIFAVLDAGGCSYPVTVEVGQPDSIELGATWISDITCTKPGTFTIDAAGGSGQFKYFAALSELPDHVLLPNPDTSSAWQTSNLFEVTEPGTYIVWAYDVVNHCLIGGEEDKNMQAVNEWRVKVLELPKPTKKVSGYKVLSHDYCGESTGSIGFSSIEFSMNGVPYPTTYISYYQKGKWNSKTKKWESDGSPMVTESDTVENLPHGTYRFVFDDETTGCRVYHGWLTIEGNDPMVVELDKGAGEFTCPDVVEGYIEANITAGGGDTIMYQLWQNGALKTNYQPVNSFLVQIGYNYVVVAKDEFGCTDTSDVLELDPVEEAAFQIKDVTCYGETMASAKVMVTGEEGRMFKLFWDEMETSDMGETDYFMGDTVLSQMFEFDEKNTTDRHYIMWVVDDQGCPSEKDTLTFKRVDGPLQVVNVADTVGECSTSFSFEIAGGTAPYMVMVDSVVVADQIGFYERITLDLFGGSHKVYVYDAQECELDYNFDLDYGTVVYDTAWIYEGDTAHYTMHGLDTMLMGGDYEFIVSDTACAKQLFVNVNERPRTAPVLAVWTPTDTIADNHPTFELTFTDMVTFENMGYLWVFEKDSADAVLKLEIKPEMISTDGMTITVDYDHTVSGGLDKNTTYVVKVDSGVVMGDGLVWEGIMSDVWMFTTGPDFKTGIDTELKNSFKVYPNPFNDYIRIDNAAKLDRVILTNIAGQRVLDIENPTYEIRTGNLVTGVYVVTLISNDEIVTSERIIKR